MAKKSLSIEGLLKNGGVHWVLLETAPIDDEADAEQIQEGIDQIKNLIKQVFNSSDGNGYINIHNCVIDISSFASFRVNVVEW
jgi:hypothetical protein